MRIILWDEYYGRFNINSSLFLKMNAFTALLALVGLGLVTANQVDLLQQESLDCAQAYRSAIGSGNRCFIPISPYRADTFEKAVEYANTSCFIDVNCTAGVRKNLTQVEKACVKDESFIITYTRYLEGSEKVCAGEQSAFCYAATEFLTNVLTSSARVLNASPTEIEGACGCVDKIGETCSKAKMMFICAKPNEVTSANETCFQLYSRSTAEFCQSDCSRKLNDAISLAKTSTLTWQGNIPNGTCISISRKFDELNLDFVQECAETVPGAPTITRTTPGDREIVVTFAAPAEKGGSAVSNYR
eukprot:760235_1